MNALTGDERAALVRSVLPYCWRTAWQIARPVLGPAHLSPAFEAAELGAWEAAARFDPGAGWVFLRFAWRRIRGAVCNYIATECKGRDVGRAAAVKAILADRAPDPADVAAANDLRGYVRRQVARLPARHRLVIELLYGFDRPAPMTYPEVAARIGLRSRQGVATLERTALGRLRSQIGGTA